ncbi:MAG: TonB family protein [Clostridia bacterium]|nr:TonB family protein [Clostridia bacterium]
MDNQKKYNSSALVVTIVFHGLLVVMLLIMALRTPLPLPGEEGVEVSLGYDVTGSGLEQPEKLQPISRVQPVVSPPPKPREIVTQNTEEAPAIPDAAKTKEKPKEKPAEQPVEEVKPPEPKVNPKALYTPQKTDATESGTQGDGTTAADQGKESGSPDSRNTEGNAQAGDGISFDLEGRGSIHLPKPAYNSPEQGRVVVKIWVNKQGQVTRVQTGVKGTTIADLKLQQLAADAAQKAVFTPNPNAADVQTGTITYNFLRRN